MTSPADGFDPETDLVLERVVDIPARRIWDAWTRPEQLVQWFTPAPWTTPACVIDLRPGGLFRTTMRSPDGEDSTNDGCFLEVVDGARLVWTTALGAGFRPAPAADDAIGFFTAFVTIEPIPAGSRYRVVLKHREAAGARAHAEMGFADGWGAAFDQLVEMVSAHP
jgi:uncharacterized protein YndB with AHSA1/START domain